MNKITLDAHTLIWYLHKNSNERLASNALKIIKETEASGIIYVSTITLMEIVRILEKRLYPVSFDTVLEQVEENEAYKIVPLTTKIVKAVRGFQSVDLHDRVIMATAIITGSILVSKDKEIRASGLKIIWSKQDNIIANNEALKRPDTKQ
ncbi:type II toxin-antitoxin system VapC family toxin [Candidatus Poribacteria bacterium]|nr:type II toxin-antitoxin system VapC family toxin [Candidatus Poribacteria bacterium]